MHRYTLTILLALLPTICQADWITIGQPGNPPLASWHGTVDYSYRVSDSLISTADWVEFLNQTAIQFAFTDAAPASFRPAAAGGYESLPGLEASPAVGIDWIAAARYVNWLQTGGTETGAYTLPAGSATEYRQTPALMLTRLPELVTRNPGAQYWLPSRDEWEKSQGVLSAATAAEVGELYWVGEYCQGSRNCFGQAAGWWRYLGDQRLITDPGLGGPVNSGIRVYSWAEGVTLLGDADADGDLDSADLLGFLGDWTGSLAPAGTWTTRSDTDRDGDVDSADLLTVLENWSGALAQVPEPSSGCVTVLTLLGLAANGLRRRASRCGNRTA